MNDFDDTFDSVESNSTAQHTGLDQSDQPLSFDAAGAAQIAQREFKLFLDQDPDGHGFHLFTLHAGHGGDRNRGRRPPARARLAGRPRNPTVD